ncbi:MAG: TolC family protein [Geobacteraceae bacterium]|nr:TolC family protein [Geobacteraceae bacterium]
MINHVLVIITLVLCANIAVAETYRLSLKDAIALSLDRNNLVRSAGFAADAARQDVAITTARYYPGVFFEEAFVASNAPTQTFMMKLDEGRFSQNDFQIDNLNHPQTSHDFRTALTIQQPIYNPSTSPAREMAVKESEKQTLAYDAGKEDTAFQVFRLVLEVQKSKAQLRAVEQALGDARENKRLAAVRTGAGVGLKSDELRARTHLGSVEQQFITAGNNLMLARMQLANVVGLKEGDSIDITESIIPLTSGMPPEELVKVALESRKDLKQSMVELEKSDAALRLARSGYLPSVGSFATYQMNSKDTPFGSDNDSWIAGISLKWQLFDGFKRYHEKDRAVAARSAAAELLEARLREVRYRVRESVMRREEMGKRLEVVRNSLEDAEETVRLLTRRFENSLATMVELLDAQTALNQVRAGLVESEANYSLAGGNVYYSAGIFMKEMLK